MTLTRATLRETSTPGEFDLYLSDEDWERLAKANGNRITCVLRLKYEEPKLTQK